jgi:uncharacterized membrane protein YphA (DoxX/SURF4 family)
MAEFATKLESKLAVAAPHAHWLLRMGIAAIFLFHGIDKLTAGAPPKARWTPCS